MAPKTLPTRKIGSHSVSAIGYGCMGISANYGKPLPNEERFKVLDAVYQSGVTHWDTADLYGDSEELLGNWFKRTGKRDDIFLATKFGSYYRDGRLANGDPEYMHAQFAKSLQKLGTDHIELYYYHRPDQTVPVEKTVTAMAELVKAGKVTYLGLSECSAATIRRAHAIHPITAYQVEYSPFTLDIEDDKIGIMKTCKELGIAIVAYAPLGRGLLTGQYKSPEEFPAGDIRSRIPKFSKANFPNILKLAEGLKKIGERHNATAGQVSIAWIMAQDESITPIPGTTKIQYLEENVGALMLKLTPEELKEVREIAEQADAAQGKRYPDMMAPLLLGDTPPL